jgi:hypothetical protein
MKMQTYTEADVFALMWLAAVLGMGLVLALLVNGWQSLKAPKKRPMAIYVNPDQRCERSVYHRTDWWRIQRTQREVK